MSKFFISVGSLNAALSVILGAFAAHSLKSTISSEALNTFQTGVQYHFYHSLGLIIVGVVIQTTRTSISLSASGWSMLIGIVLFSGSLYTISLTGLGSIGIITPMGGVLFILSWVLLAVATLTNSQQITR